MAKKIVFAGGGTVGHVTLNLTLIPKFVRDGQKIHYTGDRNDIEHEQITKSGPNVTFHSIAIGKLRCYFSWQDMLDIFKVSFGILQPSATIAEIRLQVLFSKGGFVSAPPVIVTKTLGVSVFVHESDLSMGSVNKITYKFATTMYTTFKQVEGLVKVKHVGMITKVGSKVDYDDSKIEETKNHSDPNLKTLLSTGGSAGVYAFDNFITNTPELIEHFSVINIPGDKCLNGLSQNLYRVDYVTDLHQPLMDMADVVVTRGGSDTIFELVTMHKLHLIAPLGKGASHGDQLKNAAYFEKENHVRQLAEERLTFTNPGEELAQPFVHEDSYQTAMAVSNEIRSQDEFYHLITQDTSKIIEGV